MRLRALALMVVGVIGLVLIGASSALAAPGDTIVRLTLDGVVDPFSASYIETAIDRANQDGPSAILITIDTPGGLDTSMRKIIQSILASEVPVICYVSPDGARAASAGTFMLMSCPIAAMAPGTNVGAAHPVGVSGAIAGEKATNDAAGYIRSLAEEKGRNADWAEEAVRDSDSISAAEALRMDVIDLVSPSISGLLDEVDGRTVRVAGGTEVVLATAGAEVVERDQGLGGRILHPLFSPNYAFIFFYLGLSLIIIEILAPGVSIPGILGTIFVSIALASFGMLPVQIIGLVLLAASVGFFLVELHAPGVGAPAIGGVVSLIAGGLLLFDRSVPGAQVSPGVIAPVAMGIALFFYFVVKAALKTRHLPQSVKSQAALGATGYATTDLAPGGIVHVAAETWTAEATGPVAKGQKVRVIGVEGLRLRVEPIDDEPQQLELEE